MSKFDWFLSAVVCMSILSIGVAIIRWIETNPKRAARIIMVVVVLAMLLVGGKTAIAEPAEVEYYSVDKIVATEVMFDNFWPTTRIDFVYHEDILSWYEDGFAMPWNHYVVKVWREREVVNSALL